MLGKDCEGMKGKAVRIWKKEGGEGKTKGETKTESDLRRFWFKERVNDRKENEIHMTPQNKVFCIIVLALTKRKL
jgi:hypothetical protein